MANINDMDNIRRIAENRNDYSNDAAALREAVSSDSCNLGRTAQNTEETVYQFKKLNDDLANERISRKKGDRLNLILTILSLLLSLASFLVSLK